MIKLLSLFAVSLALLNVSCATYRASDFELLIQLPASEDCYGVRVMSGNETRYPKEQCALMIKRAIFLTSANWKMLKGDIQTNCQYTQCAQITGAADNLFLTIDDALKRVPLP